MSVSYEGIGYLAVTFPKVTATVGKVCKLNLLGRVEECENGDKFCGVVQDVDDATAAVQLEGFVEVGFTGNTPARGYTKLSCDGNGGVKVDTAGKEYLVVRLNSAKSKIIMKL